MSRELAPVIWDVVEEHLDEAEFLSLSWARALGSAKYTIFEVAQEPEERLAAQLDGVAVGGIAALERLLLPALGSEEPARVGAAALAICRIPGAPVDAVLEAIQKAEAPCSAAAAKALALSGHASAQGALAGLLESEDPKVQAAALEALALRGFSPGPRIDGLLASEDGPTQAAALRAARGAGPRCRIPIRKALGSRDPLLRNAAIETGLILGLRSAWQMSQELARANDRGAGFALRVLAMSGEPVDALAIEKALAVEALRPAAIWALGLLGTRRAADLCLPLLSSPALGGLAGEAFCAITGLEVTPRIRAMKPEDEDRGPAGEDEDVEPHLAPSALEDLPLLAPDAVSAWWRGARPQFDPNARHVQGRVLDFETLREAFARASTRRRRAMALELRVRGRGAYRAEPEIWAAEQISLQNRPVEVSPQANLPLAALLQG